MILEKNIYSKDDLKELLNCFLQLNSPYYHSVIVRAFTEIWNGVFSVKPSVFNVTEKMDVKVSPNIRQLLVGAHEEHFSQSIESECLQGLSFPRFVESILSSSSSAEAHINGTRIWALWKARTNQVGRGEEWSLSYANKDSRNGAGQLSRHHQGFRMVGSVKLIASGVVGNCCSPMFEVQRIIVATCLSRVAIQSSCPLMSGDCSPGGWIAGAVIDRELLVCSSVRVFSDGSVRILLIGGIRVIRVGGVCVRWSGAVRWPSINWWLRS
nr:transcription repressor OFP6-like [Ipomoea batatas]